MCSSYTSLFLINESVFEKILPWIWSIRRGWCLCDFDTVRHMYACHEAYYDEYQSERSLVHFGWW